MQLHMSTQDFNFEVFASYVTKFLVSLWTDVNANHDDVLARINHLISAQEADFALYERFYRKMCGFLDS